MIATLTLENFLNPVGFLGVQDNHLKILEKNINVSIYHRGNQITIEGEEDREIKKAQSILTKLYQLSQENNTVSSEEVCRIIENVAREGLINKSLPGNLQVSSGKKFIELKNYAQQKYISTIEANDITFSIGPAGTGKTYLAVAAALHYLMEKKVRKVILTRPVVEAGESLGFLPGSMEDKIDPYLKPLMDSIYDMLTVDEIVRYKEKGQIEIAPLAYMRGRTLNNSFIILDEAQNTTNSQMKMFLTRLGTNSKVVVTGDITQKDLFFKDSSGLELAIHILKNIKGIGFNFFDKKDVVRHPIVVKILEAFEKYEKTE